MEFSIAVFALLETLDKVLDAFVEFVFADCTNKKIPNVKTAIAIVTVVMIETLTRIEKRIFFAILSILSKYKIMLK